MSDLGTVLTEAAAAFFAVSGWVSFPEVTTAAENGVPRSPLSRTAG